MDNVGNLHLLGRVSTLIVTEGGKKVQPDDVEEAYAEEKAIREIGRAAKGREAGRADRTGRPNTESKTLGRRFVKRSSASRGGFLRISASLNMP